MNHQQVEIIALLKRTGNVHEIELYDDWYVHRIIPIL